MAEHSPQQRQQNKAWSMDDKSIVEEVKRHDRAAAKARGSEGEMGSGNHMRRTSGASVGSRQAEEGLAEGEILKQQP
jgi:hypothetical protein